VRFKSRTPKGFKDSGSVECSNDIIGNYDATTRFDHFGDKLPCLGEDAGADQDLIRRVLKRNRNSDDFGGHEIKLGSPGHSGKYE